MISTFLFKWLGLTYNLTFLVLLQSLYLTDVLVPSYETLVSGMVGSVIVIITEIVLRLKQKDNKDPKAKEFTNITWITFAVQPIGAAMASWLTSHAYRIFTENEGLVFGRIYSSKIEFAFGVLSGIFYIWVFKPETLQWLTKTILYKFINKMFGSTQ